MDCISIRQLSEKWAVPADAKKPKDARSKSGKYIKAA